jgi:hypothetical protein
VIADSANRCVHVVNMETGEYIHHKGTKISVACQVLLHVRKGLPVRAFFHSSPKPIRTLPSYLLKQTAEHSLFERTRSELPS